MDNLLLSPSYAPRHRECSQRNAIPTTNDVIEVLWEMDEDDAPCVVWWKADVIGITGGDPRPGILGVGVIKYVAYKNYPPTPDAVEFLPDQCLRVVDYAGENQNENPPLSWRVCISQHSSDTDLEDCNGEEDDWDWEVPDETTPRSRKRGAGSLPPLPQILFQVKKMKECHDRMLREVLQLKQQVTTQAISCQGPQYESDKSITDRVMCFLRSRMSIRMQKPVRRVGKGTEQVEDGQAGIPAFQGRISGSSVTASTDCDLDEFEAIARFIHTMQGRGEGMEAVTFHPAFPMTQNASLGDNHFFVVFPCLKSICHILGISSESDRIEMIERYGTQGKATLLRLLGTYVSDVTTPNNEDNSGPCSIVVGKSCLDGCFDNSPSLGGTAVLRRDSGAYIDVERRYAENLYKTDLVPQNMGDPREIGLDVHKKAFYLRWRRDVDPNSRIWSKEICRSTRVTGTLQVVFPTILIPGNNLVDEVEKLLDENALRAACN